MFLLNAALTSIDAAESNVVTVHRSGGALFLSPEGHQQQLCEAFLCVVRDNGSERVHPALFLTRTKQSLVYAADTARQPVATAEAVQRGIDFLETMGFQMENCNLGGNPALRKVVLGGIKVLRHPGASAAARQGVQQDSTAGGAASLAARPAPTAKAPAHEPAAGPVAEPGADLEKLRGELQRVTAEKEALQAESHRRIAELEGELAQARAELARLGDARQETAATSVESAEHELELLREDYQALRAEYQMINEELTERQNATQRLQSEQTGAQQRAAEEIAALKAAVLRLSGGEARPERPASQPSPAPAARNDPEPQPTPGLGQADRDAAEEPVTFRHDPDLVAIPCRSTDDIIDLRVSFNTIRMTCGSASAQNCAAYICGLERQGAREVYLAIHLTQDNTAMIYVPRRQPVDPAGYERALEGAIAFADVSGFIVNMERLSGSPAARAKILERVPVLGS